MHLPSTAHGRCGPLSPPHLRPSSTETATRRKSLAAAVRRQVYQAVTAIHGSLARLTRPGMHKAEAAQADAWQTFNDESSGWASRQGLHTSCCTQAGWYGDLPCQGVAPRIPRHGRNPASADVEGSRGRAFLRRRGGPPRSARLGTPRSDAGPAREAPPPRAVAHARARSCSTF